MAEMKRLPLDITNQLGRYRGPETGRLLEIGCGQGDFLLEAQREAYDVYGVWRFRLRGGVGKSAAGCGTSDDRNTRERRT